MSSTPSPPRPHSRQSSIHSRYINQPSRLRQLYSPTSNTPLEQGRDRPSSSAEEPRAPHDSEASTASTLVNKTVTTARDKIVESYFRLAGSSSCNNCGSGVCEHGALSPHPRGTYENWDDTVSQRSNGSYGGRFDARGGDTMHSLLGDAVADGLIGDTIGSEDQDDFGGIKKTSTTERLARTHGITKTRRMYVRRMATSQLSTIRAMPSRNATAVIKGRLTPRIPQVSHLLLSVLAVDIPVQVVLPSRRPDCRTDNGFILPAHVTIVRLQSGACTTNQWALFFCIQPNPICFSGQLPPDGSGP